jgi:hypothetical protein
MRHLPSRAIRLVLRFGLLASAACGEMPAAVTDPGPPPALGVAHQSDVDAFIAAQGTFCTPDGGSTGACVSLFGSDGPPDVVVWCDITSPTPCPYFDTGVYSRWLLEQGGPDLGTTWRGTVRERRLDDGRRHIVVDIDLRNALVHLGDFEALLAAFDNQELLETLLAMGHLAHAVRDGAPALLGEHSIRYEFILPADYAGMPDIVEVIYAPQEGMEFLGFDASGSAVGTMRSDYLGLDAGERARVSMHFNWDAAKEGSLPGQAPARGIRQTAGSPGMHMDLIPMP